MVIASCPLLFGIALSDSGQEPKRAGSLDDQPAKALSRIFKNLPYANGFYTRAAIYFAVWLRVMFHLQYWSKQQDANSKTAL